MKEPRIFETAAVARGAVVLGDVTVGADSSIWYNAVIRGDANSVTIGERSNIQDNAVLHVSHEHPLVIGNDVTVGHGAILHGCTIEDGALIGMGAVILDGAVIGKGSIIAAGALVTQNKIIPEGSLMMGNPAKLRREVTEEEKQANLVNAANYVRESKEIVR